MRRTCILAFSCIVISLVLVPSIFCQDDETDPAPPPIKFIPKIEKDEMSSQPDLKSRTRLSLSFMDGHLVAAERLTAEHDACGAFKELGMFQAVMGETLEFLEKSDTKNDRTLDALRKLEIGLRAFMPRLETMRRDLPLNCDEYVRGLMRTLRDARAKAIDPMFSDNVVKAKGNLEL